MRELVSHTKPPLKLWEHLQQVGEAAMAIWMRHGERLASVCAEVRLWVENGVLLHDVGKGGEGFQEYIIAPERYRGDKLAKAHTLLSFVCALNHGRSEGWDWRRRLAVAVLAACHHSEFKTREELEHIVADGRKVDAIEAQLATLDWDALDFALGVALPRLIAGSDACGDALDVLMDELFPEVDRLVRISLDEALGFRLRCQLAFSILLEADKAFLAVRPEHLHRYLSNSEAELPPSLVDGAARDEASHPLGPAPTGGPRSDARWVAHGLR